MTSPPVIPSISGPVPAMVVPVVAVPVVVLSDVDPVVVLSVVAVPVVVLSAVPVPVAAESSCMEAHSSRTIVRSSSVSSSQLVPISDSLRRVIDPSSVKNASAVVSLQLWPIMESVEAVCAMADVANKSGMTVDASSFRVMSDLLGWCLFGGVVRCPEIGKFGGCAQACSRLARYFRRPAKFLCMAEG